MSDHVLLDHLEIHVDDVPRYCEFLRALFAGGRHRVLGEDGTAMFVTRHGNAFEIKKRTTDAPPLKSGFCLPCIRTAGARAHIEALGLEIDETTRNPDGEVHFFTDHEGVRWHAKDYARQDDYINW